MSKKLIFIGGMALVCLAQSVFASEKAKLFHKTASLQCLDRKVELQADCFDGDYMYMFCTSQSLNFTDGATGKKINSHVFKAAQKKANEDYPVVADQVDAVNCVKTPANEKYIVTMLSNGGNCEKCEWQEIYSWDGSYVGSNRDKNKPDELKSIFNSVNNKASKTFGKMVVEGFYQMKEDK